MNLEIANRLVALRKENNLSQEALAEKLGISRQAVSKWERAEASPDTDNLIALAKLYHISLDELLKIHEDGEEEESCRAGENDTNNEYNERNDRNERNKCGNESNENAQSDGYAGTQQADDGADYVHVGFDGIHVRDKDGEVRVGWQGIHVHDKGDKDAVDIDKNGVYVNGEEVKGHLFTRGKDAEAPIGMIAVVAYIIIGAVFDLWHPGWLIFLLVPVVSSLIHAVRKHNPNLFAYPVLAAFAFLYAGLFHSLWHPAWVVFLTIPVYYSIVNYIVRTRTDDEEDEV